MAGHWSLTSTHNALRDLGWRVPVVHVAGGAGKQLVVAIPDGGAVEDGVDVVDKLCAVAGGAVAKHFPLIYTINRAVWVHK